MKYPYINLFHIAALACVLLGMRPLDAGALTAVDGLNGHWQIDEDRSDDFDDAAKQFNKDLNESIRRNSEQKFHDPNKGQKRGQFDGQAYATLEMIREDARSISWDVSDEVRAILEADSIKLYQARKCAVLYGNKLKRLLTVNPKGKAYSVSGEEITSDDVGSSVTYVENGALVIDTDLLEGDELQERYELDADTEHMNLTMTLRRRGLPRALEIKRVYGRSE